MSDQTKEALRQDIIRQFAEGTSTSGAGSDCVTLTWQQARVALTVAAEAALKAMREALAWIAEPFEEDAGLGCHGAARTAYWFAIADEQREKAQAALASLNQPETK